MYTLKKRVRALFLAAVMLLSLAAAASAAETRTQNADIVLVMDDTGSMTWNDPLELAKVAIEQFGVNMPFADTHIGVVTFSTEVIQKFPMVRLDAQSQSDLKDFASKALTRKGMYTDLSVGLAEAVRMLQGVEDSDNSKVIIAVTDGANDYGAGRTEAMSAKDLAEVERVAQEKGIRIHLVAINSDQDVVSAYLNGIASVTDGSVTFVKTAAEVSAALEAIYEDVGLISRDASGSETVRVDASGVTLKRTVPENVFEVIFNLKHSAPIELTITDPAGAEIYPSNAAGNAISSVSDLETVVKVQEPDPGEYTLSIKNLNVPEQDVTLSIYRNSEVQVVVSCPGSAEPDKDFSVSAQLMREGDVYTGVDLQNLTATAVLKNGSKEVTLDLPLAGDKFTGTVALKDEGDWEVTVEIRSSKSFSRTNDQPEVVKVKAPAAPAAPKPTTPNPAEKEVNWILIAAIAVAAVVLILVLLKVLGLPPFKKKTPIPMCSLEIRCQRRSMGIWSMVVSPGHALKKRNRATLMEIIEEENRLAPGHISLEPGDKPLYSRVTLSAELNRANPYFVWTVKQEDGTVNRIPLNPDGFIRVDLNDPDNTCLMVEWRAF